MDAGRELDKLIAEKVMNDVERYLPLYKRLTDLSAKEFVSGETKPIYIPVYKGGNLNPKRYSTDIAAAWEVINKIYSLKGFMLELSGTHGNLGWGCSMFLAGVQDLSEDCESAPHAICLAALKVMKINI